MSQSPQPGPPPAGWYPSPDGTPRQAYWDGTAWTAFSQPLTTAPAAAPTTAPANAPQRRSLAGLGWATRIAVAVAGVAALIGLPLEIWGVSVMQGYLDGLEDDAALDRYDTLTAELGLVFIVALVTAAILWLVWQHRAASNADPALLKRTPGWHVGAWFVPVVYLWFPYQHVSSLFRAGGVRVPGWLPLWWGTWLVGNFTSAAAARTLFAAEYLEDVISAAWFSGVSNLCFAVGAVFAWLVVARVSSVLGPAPTYPSAA